MTISATAVRFDDHTMWVDLTDGPPWVFPWHGVRACCALIRLNATASRSAWIGLLWEELDEDISIAGLIAGRSDMTKPEHAVSA
jgi:hypothetical protein